MTTLCITGGSPRALAAINEQLRQAGMAADKPLQRDPAVNLSVWHQRVLGAVQQDVSAADHVIQPGRLWEQLAVDLLLANLDEPFWGWGDTSSIALLDFWAELDDSIRFVLLCRSREQVVGEWLRDSADQRSIDALLADWQGEQQALLRFHLQRPARTVLVWAEQAQNEPHALVARLRQQWRIDLDLPDAQPVAVLPCDAVQRQLVTHILQHHPESIELDGELHATVFLLTEGGRPLAALPEAAELAIDYRRLLDRSAEQAALEAARAACAAEAHAKAEAQAQRDVEAKAKAEAIQQRDAEAAAKETAQTQIAELTKACDAEAKAKAEAQVQLKEAQQEGELLLQQLHMVQEELEKQFLQNKEDQAQHQAQIAELTKARDGEAKAKAEATQQRDAEAAAKKTAQAQIAELTKARDAEAKAKAESQAQLKEAQQEGELLLQQLHMVQEELEQYYLKHQAAQKEVDQLNTRCARLLKIHPDLVDVDAVELAADGGDGKPLLWRLKQASIGGRHFAELEFSTLIEQGVAGFVWRRPEKGAGLLARWPASAKGEQEVTILPVAGGPDAIRRAAHLVQLSSADTDLMLALPAVIKRALQDGEIPLAPQRQQALISGLNRFEQIMLKAQTLVRFDRARLIGQQSNTQRDVIALALTGLSFGELRLPGMEFQLQLNKAANGSVESMHLIFAQKTAGAPFMGWFSNVPNTAGEPVMALNLTARGWAPGDWTVLPAEDRAFVQALVDSLAVVLVTLQADRVPTERPWSDWLSLPAVWRQWSRQTPAVVAAPPEPETLPTPTPPMAVEEAKTVLPPTPAPEHSPEPAASSAAELKTPKPRKPRAKAAKPVASVPPTPAPEHSPEPAASTAAAAETPETPAPPEPRKPRAKAAKPVAKPAKAKPSNIPDAEPVASTPARKRRVK